MYQREFIEGVEDMGTMSDINVTPFIDIMLVLLIIFMVTAPLMLGGVHVNLPKTKGMPMHRPTNPVVVSIDAERRIYVNKKEVPEAGRHEFFQSLAQESETGEVYVRGDKEIKYGDIMSLIAQLGQAGFARVSLVTSVTGEQKTAPGAPAAEAAAPGSAPAASSSVPAPAAEAADGAAPAAGGQQQ